MIFAQKQTEMDAIRVKMVMGLVTWYP